MDILYNLYKLFNFKIYPQRPSPLHFPFRLTIGLDPYHENRNRFISPILYFNQNKIKINLIDKETNQMVIWLTVYELPKLQSDINGGAVPWLHGLTRLNT